MNKYTSLFILIFFIGCVPINTNPQPSDTPIPSESPIIQDYGILNGNVEIGPLCPVEPCNISDEQKENIYSARKILIYNQDRTQLVKTIQLDKTGLFEIELPVGIYILDKEQNGIESSNLPVKVVIELNRVENVNITIDTGIR